jgi:N-methylhydantoinase B
VIRIRTTGGGGWGDPLDRDPALVLRDVRQGKVSVGAARDDYGVMIVDDVFDEAATIRERTAMRAARPARRPFFDRGAGYLRLAGQSAADCDWLA